MEGSGRGYIHWWYRINHHGERDNVGGVVACDVSVQSLVVFNTLFAVRFQVSMIGGAFVMQSTVRIGASSITLCSASRSWAQCSASTLCSSATGRGGLRIFLTCSARSLSKQCPFVVSLAWAVCSVSSLVKAHECWCGINEGNWQCCGNSLVEPEIR